MSQAANYLDSQKLLDLSCIAVAKMIKGTDLCHSLGFNKVIISQWLAECFRAEALITDIFNGPANKGGY